MGTTFSKQLLGISLNLLFDLCSLIILCSNYGKFELVVYPFQNVLPHLPLIFLPKPLFDGRISANNIFLDWIDVEFYDLWNYVSGLCLKEVKCVCRGTLI